MIPMFFNFIVLDNRDQNKDLKLANDWTSSPIAKMSPRWGPDEIMIIAGSRRDATRRKACPAQLK